ncbi:Acetyl-CoA deacylase [Aphelenchoides besseyi]|nr:Acetyl-CoA deacylase [Aphelenchoides besseyi]KAI6199982.1 Acetyl-CoA deacylase [Aphelenchoides besseyi]
MMLSAISARYCVRRSLSGLRSYDRVRDLQSPRTAGGQRTAPKRVSIDEAVACVKSGDYVYLHHAASTPVDLLNALFKNAKAKRLSGIRTTHALLLGDIPFSRDPSVYDYIRPVCYFVSTPIRAAVNAGKADYIPIFLNETSRLYDEKQLPVDVAFLNLSPPDSHGLCSLGVSVDMSSAAARNAKVIVATFNQTQPRTFGDSVIHVSQLDYVVSETQTPICSVNPPPISDAERKIGRLIAEKLVPNEATLQLGIGSLPDAVLSALTDHRHLGVHTEMISDGVVDLIERGILTNAKKTVYPGKSVLAFAIGSRRFYDIMHDCPNFLFGSVGFTNDCGVIARQHRMTSINAALEVDLCGAVAADTIGPKFFSGFGGQVDFVYGSATALDGQGKSIIALQSRTEKGEPKIVPFLKTGSSVVTTRAHVRYVVTEYGIASLWGKSVRERANELIKIAHPDDRESLEKAAFERFGSGFV